METNSGPTKEQLGSICGWIRIGESYPLNEQTVARMGGWDNMENKTLLKKDSLECHDPGSCRYVTEIRDTGLLAKPIQMTEKLLTARGLFRSPEHVANTDLLPMPRHLLVTAVPRPSPAITAIIRPSRGLESGLFSQAARRALEGGGRGRGRGNQQQGESSSSGAGGSSAAADSPADPPVGRADKAGGTALTNAGILSSNMMGKLPVEGGARAQPGRVL